MICGEQSGIVDVFPAGSLILAVNIVTAMFSGDRGSTVVKVLCYKSEGR